MIELFIEFFIDFAKVFPLYFALVFLPGLFYSRYVRKLGQRITDGSDVFTNGILIPYQEEVLFRYVPYFAGGLVLVIPATIIWAFAHPIVRGYQKNKKLFLVSSLYYLSSGTFYIIALSQNILLPLVYHIMHNSIIEYSVYSRLKNIEKELKKSEIVKVKQTEEVKTQEMRKINIKVPYPFEYVYYKPIELEKEIEEIRKFDFAKAKL